MNKRPVGGVLAGIIVALVGWGVLPACGPPDWTPEAGEEICLEDTIVEAHVWENAMLTDVDPGVYVVEAVHTLEDGGFPELDDRSELDGVYDDLDPGVYVELRGNGALLRSEALGLHASPVGGDCPYVED
jgi:hypothetical protein